MEYEQVHPSSPRSGTSIPVVSDISLGQDRKLIIETG